MMASAAKTSQKLEEFIIAGDLENVKKLLDPIDDSEQIKAIEENFGVDPVKKAVQCREETVALYLIEKGFRYNTVSDLAHEYQLNEVEKLLHQIRQNGCLEEDASESVNEVSRANGVILSVPAARRRTTQLAESLRSQVAQYGAEYRDTNGNTLPHSSISLHPQPTAVYVYSSSKIPINDRNREGDTALHLAAKKTNRAVISALLQSGADMTIRNNLGQLPIDLAGPSGKELLNSYSPGLVSSIFKGKVQCVRRFTQRWCSVTSSVVHRGMTSLELAASLANESPRHSACHDLLKAYRPTSELTHAVLSEDIGIVEHILKNEKGWNTNQRFKEKYGPTLLSWAVDQHSMELVRLLVEYGSANINVLVKENDQDSHILPLILKSISSDIPKEIFQYLWPRSGCQHSQRDHNGNSLLLRAVQERVPCDFVKVILALDQSFHTDRNKKGLNARELSQQIGKTEHTALIDQCILENVTGSSPKAKFFLLNLAVSAYGRENLDITDMKSGKSLKQLVEESRDPELKATFNNYNAISDRASSLFKAVANGDKEKAQRLNNANYKDKNGYTALIRAIVFNQCEIADLLMTERPSLKDIPDNCNRYPLHYAYAVGGDDGERVVRLILQGAPQIHETTIDMYGRFPADYRELRKTEEIKRMLHDARTLDINGMRGFNADAPSDDSSQTAVT